ncbi:MAG: hypothetical protein NTV05_02190 [Acidobacteria bacterium]|nr:hypothetical protein [Acidobacteriota bacterium]
MGIHAQRGPALPDLRRAAADYLVKYAQQLSAVAAEEECLQLDTSAVRMTATSSLRSEFVLVGLADGAVAGFRDVFELDGGALRERGGSLLTLFRTPPTAASLERARELTTESARHYISPDLRWLDEPTLALEFLRQKNQERSTFTLDGVRKMDGSQVAILKFKERSTPRLIPSPDNAPVSGSFWIEVVSGAVRRTELILSGRTFDFRVTVNYAAEPKLGLWLPADMHQRIDISGVDSGGSSQLGGNFSYPARRSFETRAKYSKFRQVSAMSPRFT